MIPRPLSDPMRSFLYNQALAECSVFVANRWNLLFTRRHFIDFSLVKTNSLLSPNTAFL